MAYPNLLDGYDNWKLQSPPEHKEYICRHYEARMDKKGRPENDIWCKIHHPGCMGKNLSCRHYEEEKP